MRRYVQTTLEISNKIKSSKPSKSRQSRQSRQSVQLTFEELQSLPAEFRSNLTIPTVKQPKPVKTVKVREPLDDAFVNKRSPGSKTVLYRRQVKQPLYSLEDRLNRANVVSREDDTFSFRGNSFHVIEWTCMKTVPADDVNIHLIDYNQPDEEPELYYITNVTLESAPTSTDYLLETPVGRVCPKCKTNEYIKSDLKSMPVSYQDIHRFNRDSFGESCQRCKCISKDLFQATI